MTAWKADAKIWIETSDRITREVGGLIYRMANTRLWHEARVSMINTHVERVLNVADTKIRREGRNNDRR